MNTLCIITVTSSANYFITCQHTQSLVSASLLCLEGLLLLLCIMLTLLATIVNRLFFYDFVFTLPLSKTLCLSSLATDYPPSMLSLNQHCLSALPFLGVTCPFLHCCVDLLMTSTPSSLLLSSSYASPLLSKTLCLSSLPTYYPLSMLCCHSPALSACPPTPWCLLPVSSQLSQPAPSSLLSIGCLLATVAEFCSLVPPLSCSLKLALSSAWQPTHEEKTSEQELQSKHQTKTEGEREETCA